MLTLAYPATEFEGGAIASELTGQEPPRPMTHDLMMEMLKSTHAKVDDIVITDLRDNTYFAEIHMSVQGAKFTIDSRPSDALAVAVVAAVKQWRFMPAESNGKPVATRVSLPVKIVDDSLGAARYAAK